MAQLGKIPATVITGFLGAGKTTMIRNMLENANGKRIALIINEFGDLGVDRGIINGCGIEGCAEDDVVELAKGWIWGAVAGGFRPVGRKAILPPGGPVAGANAPGAPNPVQLRGQPRHITDFPSPNVAPNLTAWSALPKRYLVPRV